MYYSHHCPTAWTRGGTTGGRKDVGSKFVSVPRFETTRHVAVASNVLGMHRPWFVIMRAPLPQIDDRDTV